MRRFRIKNAMAMIGLSLKRLLCLFGVLLAMGAKAQQYEQAQTVQLIEHKIVIPEGGSLEEALSLSQEWTEHVLRKNENFEQIQLLLSDTKKDTVSLMVLYKYKAEIKRDTNEINQELIRKHWPEDGAFESFLKQLHAYINPRLNERSVFKELILKDQ